MTIPPQHHHYYDWLLLCPSRYVDLGGLERAKVWPKSSWIMQIVLCLPLHYTFCPHNHPEGTLRYIYIYIYVHASVPFTLNLADSLLAQLLATTKTILETESEVTQQYCMCKKQFKADNFNIICAVILWKPGKSCYLLILSPFFKYSLTVASTYHLFEKINKSLKFTQF